MKINEDLFLKYNSDLLPENEKVEFEKLLTKNPEIDEQFNAFKTKLNSIKIDGKIDERYFNSLLPKVREKIDNKIKKKTVPKLAYALPLLVLISYLVFNYTNNPVPNNISKEDNFTELYNNVDLTNSYLSDLFLTESISLTEDKLVLNLGSDYLKDINNLQAPEIIIDEGAFEENFYNNYVNYFPEDELNKVYTELHSSNNL